MKKLYFIPLMLVVLSVAAQEQFKVPDLTLEIMYDNMLTQTNYSMLNTISYAKSKGQSPEDAAVFMGNMYKTSWNKDAGFGEFVKGVLYNLVCIVPDGEVTIEEQSAERIKIKATSVFPLLYRQGEVLGINYDEYCRFMGKTMEIIGEYMGADLNLETEKNNWIVTLEKRKPVSVE